MKTQFRNVCIDKDITIYGEKCNIITFNEDLFNEYQLVALSKQYEKLGFLKCECKYRDENVDMYYYTTNLISIDDYFSKTNINKTEFVSIIKTICQSVKLCSNYAYFNKNNLILNEELIYIDSSDKSIHIMYVPTSEFISNDVIYDLKKLIVNLINNNVIINNNEESFTQEILESLRSNYLSIDDLISFLDNIIKRKDDILKPKIEKIVQQTIEPIKVEQFKPESFTYNMEEKYSDSKKDNNKGFKGFFKKLFSSNNDHMKISNNTPNYNTSANANYSIYNDGSDDTVILGCNMNTIAYLASDNFGEKIEINKDSFIIGRLKNVVDYEIENKTVGKMHAKFIKQNDKFYLIDLESKNGTYINSTKLMPNSLYEVEDGANIIFSNVKYTFHIEKK